MRKYVSYIFESFRFFLVGKLLALFSINGVKKVTNPKFKKSKRSINASFLVRKLQCLTDTFVRKSVIL